MRQHAHTIGLTERERKSLDTDGYVILSDLFPPDQVADMRRAADEALAGAPRADPTWRPGGTLHVNLDGNPAFDCVGGSDRLRAAVSHLLGPHWRQARLSLRAPQPGFGAQTLHGAATLPPAKRGVLTSDDRYELVTAIIALVDFTVDNGATRVVPGSHRTWSLRVPPNPDAAFPPAKILCCSAGSAIVFPEALVHSGTRNRSPERRDSLQISWVPG